MRIQSQGKHRFMKLLLKFETTERFHMTLTAAIFVFQIQLYGDHIAVPNQSCGSELNFFST